MGKSKKKRGNASNASTNSIQAPESNKNSLLPTEETPAMSKVSGEHSEEGKVQAAETEIQTAQYMENRTIPTSGITDKQCKSVKHSENTKVSLEESQDLVEVPDKESKTENPKKTLEVREADRTRLLDFGVEKRDASILIQESSTGGAKTPSLQLSNPFELQVDAVEEKREDGLNQKLDFGVKMGDATFEASSGGAKTPSIQLSNPSEMQLKGGMTTSQVETAGENLGSDFTRKLELGVEGGDAASLTQEAKETSSKITPSIQLSNPCEPQMDTEATSQVEIMEETQEAASTRKLNFGVQGGDATLIIQEALGGAKTPSTQLGNPSELQVGDFVKSKSETVEEKSQAVSVRKLDFGVEERDTSILIQEASSSGVKTPSIQLSNPFDSEVDDVMTSQAILDNVTVKQNSDKLCTTEKREGYRDVSSFTDNLYPSASLYFHSTPLTAPLLKQSLGSSLGAKSYFSKSIEISSHISQLGLGQVLSRSTEIIKCGFSFPELIDEILIQLIAQIRKPVDEMEQGLWQERLSNHWVGIQVVTNTFPGSDGRRSGLVAYMEMILDEEKEGESIFSKRFAEGVKRNMKSRTAIERKTVQPYFELKNGKVIAQAYEN